MWKTLLLCCTVVCVGLAYESRVVNTAQGPVRGYQDPESRMYAFHGIPYARVPIGPDRFKAPLPPPSWMDPFEAVIQNIACPQQHIPEFPGYPDLNRQEECLIANVFVPGTEETNLPVVVNVHGGGFQMASAAWVPLTNLISENNVLVVTVNYRLGIHGFLCLGTEDVPGNAGMKDLVAALKWVKNNIASFGGNPDDVTIQGASAGSAAVDLLMLSKSAEGLFTKVIPESGANIAQWTIQSDPLEYAKQLARDLNFSNVDDIYALEQFYKTTPFEQLSSLAYLFQTNSTFGLSPCVERSTGADVFLDRSPVDILKSGDYKKVPILYGLSEMEGLMRIDMFDHWKDKMNEKFSDFLPSDLKFVSDVQKEEVAKRVKEFYFGDNPVGEDTSLSYFEYFTDIIIAYPMLRSVKYHVEAGHDQVYLYEYSFVDDDTPFVPHTTVRGAPHCAQSMAVAGAYSGFRDPENTTAEFLKHSTTMRIIWNSFIRTGKPVGDESVPAWPAVGAGWAPHMSLGNEFSLHGALLERRTRFWDEIYAEHYRDPIPPPAPPPKPRRTEF